MGELPKTFDWPWRKSSCDGPECNGTKTYSVEATSGSKIISQGCYFEIIRLDDFRGLSNLPTRI